MGQWQEAQVPPEVDSAAACITCKLCTLEHGSATLKGVTSEAADIGLEALDSAFLRTSALKMQMAMIKGAHAWARTHLLQRLDGFVKHAYI